MDYVLEIEQRLFKPLAGVVKEQRHNTYDAYAVVVNCQYHHDVHLSFAKKFSQSFIYYDASFTFDNFTCISVGIKNSVLSKYIKTIK